MIIEEIKQPFRYASGSPIMAGGRLRDIQAGSNTFTYDYSGVSQLIQSLTRPNGSYTEYQYYDQPNQMKNLKAVINKKSTGDVINKFEYTYNSRDLIETEAITNGQIIDNFIIGTTTETPNILNQIMSRSAQGQTKTYVYDLDGNLAESYTADGYKLFMTYDAQNRMKSAQYADGSSVTHRNEYSYAGNSLLAELKKYDAGSLTATTKYLRSGFLPVQERDSSNTVAREYTWGLNLGGGIGGLLNLKQGGADYSYLYDGKGNVSALIDNTQAVAASYAYDPFGKLMKKSGTLDQPYMFSTKEYDSGTGLNSYGYRFRDSCSGRWTTRDPLEEEGGINLYNFVGNNPVNYIDQKGLWGSDVHSGIGNSNYGTYLWAMQVGFASSEAEIIAVADNATDDYANWLVVVGVPGRHFNTAGSSVDSRKAYSEMDFEAAIKSYKNGNKCSALESLGRGLHSVQDIIAHGSWPFYKVHPNWFDRADIRPFALSMTEVLTKQYLRSFLRAAGR